MGLYPHYHKFMGGWEELIRGHPYAMTLRKMIVYKTAFPVISADDGLGPR